MRIVGYASALALNACALALLVAPLHVPPLAAPAERESVTLLVPVQPPRPIQVPVAPPMLERPPVAPAPATPAPPRAETPPVAIVVENGVLPVTVELPAIDTAPPVAATQPVSVASPAAMRLEYAVAPPPPYPRADLRAGNEGTVVLQVLVDEDGRPLEVGIAEGSGHRGLDAAARRHVLAHWRFRPATRDGMPVQAIGLVPVAFSLR